jgi:hypothetical protein
MLGIQENMEAYKKEKAALDAVNAGLETQKKLTEEMAKIGKSFSGTTVAAPTGGNIGTGSLGGGDSTKTAEKSAAEQIKEINKELERMLDLMEQLSAIRNFNREMTALNGTYYKNRGELSSYIRAMEDEYALIQSDSGV